MRIPASIGSSFFRILDVTPDNCCAWSAMARLVLRVEARRKRGFKTSRRAESTAARGLLFYGPSAQCSCLCSRRAFVLSRSAVHTNCCRVVTCGALQPVHYWRNEIRRARVLLERIIACKRNRVTLCFETYYGQGP